MVILPPLEQRDQGRTVSDRDGSKSVAYLNSRETIDMQIAIEDKNI
jgi:hypothetical protein